VAHLAAHAPTPEAFAAGVTAVVDDPTAACAFAARRAGAEDLAVLTERYGLTPGEAAAVFAAAGVRSDVAVEAVHLRCDHDLDATFEIASHVLGVGGDVVTAILTRNVAEVVALDAQHPSIDDIGEMVEVATGAGIDS
jgi:5,10-methenyltetrahydromethanopterin hydrogenase